jgi:RNA polymerase sigma factor (sigma-70 family)
MLYGRHPTANLSDVDELEKWLADYRRDHAPEVAEKILLAAVVDVRLFVMQKVRKDEAADVAQDIFVEIVRGLDSFKGKTRSQFFAWCHGIARHVIAQHYKELGKQPETHPDFEQFQQMAERHTLSLQRANGEKEDLDDAMEMMKLAAPECYDLITKFYLLRFKLKEIGKAYGIGPDAVRMRIRRCLGKYLKE